MRRANTIALALYTLAVAVVLLAAIPLAILGHWDAAAHIATAATILAVGAALTFIFTYHR